MEKEYASDDDEEYEVSSDIDEEPPDLLAENPAFASLVDNFLGTYEQLGRRMKPKLEGETGIEKLDTLRRALGKNERLWGLEQDSSDEDEDSVEEEDEKPRWDCETVLCKIIVYLMIFGLSLV